MRLMHMDFVEEAYWKRRAALKLALECRPVAIQMAKRKRERLASKQKDEVVPAESAAPEVPQKESEQEN